MAEMGRQPWVVYPNFSDGADPNVYQLTADAVSLTVHPVEIGISLVAFTVLYLVLGIIWFRLVKRYAREGINTRKKIDTHVVTIKDDTVLSFAY